MVHLYVLGLCSNPVIQVLEMLIPYFIVEHIWDSTDLPDGTELLGNQNWVGRRPTLHPEFSAVSSQHLRG